MVLSCSSTLEFCIRFLEHVTVTVLPCFPKASSLQSCSLNTLALIWLSGHWKLVLGCLVFLAEFIVCLESVTVVAGEAVAKFLGSECLH